MGVNDAPNPVTKTSGLPSLAKSAHTTAPWAIPGNAVFVRLKTDAIAAGQADRTKAPVAKATFRSHGVMDPSAVPSLPSEVRSIAGIAAWTNAICEYFIRIDDADEDFKN